MQPDLIPIPAERTENSLLHGHCATTGIENAQRVLRVARKNDVVNVSPSPMAVPRITFPSPDQAACTGVEVQLCRGQLTERVDSTYFLL